MKTTIKRTFFYVSITACLYAGISVRAQDLNFNEKIRQLIEKSNQPDTIPIPIPKPRLVPIEFPVDSVVTETVANPHTAEKDTTAVPHRAIRKRTLLMSDEAIYWSRHWDNSHNAIPEWYTFRDTIIVNRLFMPVLFKKENLVQPEEIRFYEPKDLNEISWTQPPYVPVRMFEAFRR